MKALSYYKASNIEDAYLKLKENEKNVVLGGGLWLKRVNKTCETIIDLSDCGLNEIKETDDEFIIGSMTTLRDLEISNLGKNYYDGVIGNAVGQVMGVPLRNSATIGGTVMGKFPFSDIITPLLAIGATLEMYPARTISLKEFLKEKRKDKEILVAIHVKKQPGRAAFKKVTLTELGFAIVNVCVSKINNKFSITVGARPLVAEHALKAMELLNNNKLSDELIEKAGIVASEELNFLDTSTNGKEYRKSLTKIYVKRLVKEIR